MPPVVALTLCTLFVLFLLWTDRKQYPDASLALWLPTIWILLTFSKPLGMWFGTGGENIEEGSPVDRVFLIVLLCLGFFILIKRKFRWTSAFKNNGFLFLLLSYMLLSCLWSDMPLIAIKRWSRELVAVVVIFVVSSEVDPPRAVESIFRRTIYVLIPFSYILINYFPQYGRMYVHHEGLLMWTGVAIHKNSLAQLCLFSALFIIWTLIRRIQGRYISALSYQAILDVFILILSFWLWGGPQHTFTYSATATVAFTVAITALLFLFWSREWVVLSGQKAFTVIIALIMIYGTITPMLGQLSLVDISSALGRDETLTGRATVWERVVPLAMERPMLGYGFGSFWSTMSRKEFDISDAHNGYLDIILSNGFIGLLLYALFLLSSVRKAQEVMTVDYDWGALWICYILVGVLINITESSFISFTSKLMATILVMTVTSSMIPSCVKKRN